MKRTIILILAAILSASIIPSYAAAGSKTFYVSPKGNDNAPGTRHKPWLTPASAIAQASEYIKNHPGEGATVIFAAGEYHIDSRITVKELNDPLVLTSGRRGQAVFTGEKAVTGWQPAFGNVLKADLKRCGIMEYGEVSSHTDRPDLYYKGKRQQIARWPDKGFAEGGKALGPTDVGDTWIHVHGTREGIIEYKDDRINRWMDEKDAKLFGYWYWDWAEAVHEMQDVDTVNHVMTLKPPYHHYGYRDNCRFYGFNMLCELDSPGEYYIDRSEGVIYWYAPEGFDSDDPQTSLSVFSGNYLMRVLRCKGLTIDNIAFTGGRNGAIYIKGGEDNLIKDCRIVRFGEDVIKLEDGTGHKIQGCFMEQLGCGGIDARGGNRKTLEPSGFVVCDNIIQDFSLYKRTYAPAVLFVGAGMTITHNLLQGSSSSALRIEGNDVDISFNQCFDLVTESDDQGGLDSYYNYSFRRIVLRNNHWRNIRGGMFAGAAAIRFDDIISGHVVSGNIFEDCGGAGFGAVQINGGKDNVISGNLFYDCHYAVSFIPWDEQTWKNKYEWQKSKVDDVDGLGPVYTARYPELKEPLDSNITRNFVSDNLVVKVEKMFNNGERTVSTNNTLVNDNIQPLEYYLQDSVLSGYGIEPIPFDEIGPRNNKYQVCD